MNKQKGITYNDHKKSDSFTASFIFFRLPSTSWLCPLAGQALPFSVEKKEAKFLASSSFHPQGQRATLATWPPSRYCGNTGPECVQFLHYEVKESALQDWREERLKCRR